MPISLAPVDVLRAVAKQLSPDELLLYRATCRAFRKIVPIQSILPGFDEDTLKWTVHGFNTEWNHTMDTADLRIRYRELPLGVDVAGRNIADKRIGDGSAYTTNGTYEMQIRKYDGNLIAYKNPGDEAKDPLYQLSLEKPWPLIHDRMLCAVEYFDLGFLVVTHALNFFVIPIEKTDTKMAASYEKVLTQPPQQKLEMKNFSKFHPRLNCIKRCLYQVNGDLWILTDHEAYKDLGSLIWVHDGVFEFVQSHIMDIHVQDDVIIMLQTNGTMYTRGTDGKKRKIDVFGNGKIVAFAITLDLRCMWVRFNNQVLIRRGEAFILPVGKAEDTESIPRLKALLERAERRIARLTRGVE